VAYLLDLGAVAVTAEMVGAMDRALEITTEYARNRIQFGAPIGRYQGVKHPLAEMYVDVETSRSLLYYAAWCVD
jgi:alkylation response protein AidB-like acyl-CoA dehydrogenase